MAIEWKTAPYPKIYCTESSPLGSRAAGRSVLRYIDVTKHNMKAGDIDPMGWVVANRSKWRQAVKSCFHTRDWR